MLLGAVIGKTLGFEAYVTLDKTKGPENRLFTKQNILTVDTMSGMRWQMPLNLQVHPPTLNHPLVLKIEGSGNRLAIDRVSENLVPDDTLRPSDDPSCRRRCFPALFKRGDEPGRSGQSDADGRRTHL